MADRNVTNSRKDRDGDITALCNPGEWWSPALRAQAIRDIEAGTHTYWVRGRTRVVVVNGPRGKYLRTVANSNPNDNLDNLPNC